MKTTIKSLKKGDKFRFNCINYVVYKPFRKWSKNDEPYLMTSNNEIFYNDELEVEKIT